MQDSAHVSAARLLLPRAGLGGWAFGGGYDWGPLDVPSAEQAVQAALETGVTLVDTAPVYGNGAGEAFLGRVLKGRRGQVLLAGKCGLVKNGSWTDHDLRPAAIRTQLEDSLSRLQTDYIDLYQIHYPDPKVSLEDAVGELARLRQAGKIRAIGLCNVTAEQIRRAVQAGPVETVQNEYSLLHRTAAEAVLPVCRELGLAFIGYGTLCGGILTGKYRQAPNLRRADARNYFYKCYRGEAFIQAQTVAARIQQTAQKRGVAAAAVAAAWVLHRPGVSCVLCGARTAAQVRQNAQASQLTLTPQEADFLADGHYATNRTGNVY